MSARFARKLPFGAQTRDGRTDFRLWAPACERVSLELQGRDPQAMQREADGWFSATADAPPGTRYRYRLPDGMAVPDPASRLQDGDVHGWSVVFDAEAHEWQNTGWRGRPWHEAVIYEAHCGLLGGFSGVSAALERLRDLGFTAIELMPINDFPGARNWGYDGVLPYAPDAAYGTPGELKTLIDHAHGLGLMVFLDVVYNHFGPDGAYQHVYGGKWFFDEGKHSPWGAAIDFNRPQVREYFVENAIYWLQEYQFDGLRFDAVHAYANQDFAEALASSIRQALDPERFVHLVMEHEGNVASLLRAGLYDAQWADDTHHALHVLLTGETEGYYADYQDASAKLARSLSEGFSWQGEVNHKGEQRGEPSAGLPTSAFVICLQNHDQIGNRALGDRLTTLADPEALRAAHALLLLCPQSRWCSWARRPGRARRSCSSPTTTTNWPNWSARAGAASSPASPPLPTKPAASRYLTRMRPRRMNCRARTRWIETRKSPARCACCSDCASATSCSGSPAPAVWGRRRSTGAASLRAGPWATVPS